MLSNTCDARRICRLLGYTRHILVIRMVRELKYKDTTRMILYITSAKHISNVEGYTMYYKEGYKVRIFYFYDIREVLL